MEILLFIIAIVIVGELAKEAKALPCFMCQEPDPDSHNKYRWVIPIEDPCQCTKFQMGSVNTRTPCRPFKVPYYDTFLLSDDPVEIRMLLNCTEGKEKRCGAPLGMQDGSIPDASITASSTYHACSTSNGRLNNQGAWCVATGDAQVPWFQVDLGDQTQVEGVIIQGDATYGERVTAYQVQYSDVETNWQYVTDGTNVNDAMTFTGNMDLSTPVISMFTNPILARYIRIRPTSYYRYISMRIELIGCKE